MTLSQFINDLFAHGNVTVASTIVPFEEQDLDAAANMLAAQYEKDKLHMPREAPAFSAGPALWASQYFYRAIQLALLRNIEASEIPQHLPEYPGEITPEAIYAADLTLRYLHDLTGLAKGLAPGDVLVQHLKKTAAAWPFSSVSIDHEFPMQHTAILLHPSLRYVYAERIIKQKNKKRLADAQVRELIQEALGNYPEVLWPGLELEKYKTANENTIESGPSVD